MNLHHPTPDDVERLRSMVDHPAGTRYRGPHDDDHRIGHARAERDMPPADVLPDSLGILLAVFAVLTVTGTVVAAGWSLFGPIGGAAALAVLTAAVFAVLDTRPKGNHHA